MRVQGENYKSLNVSSRRKAQGRSRSNKAYEARRKKRALKVEPVEEKPILKKLRSIGRIKNFLQTWSQHTEEDEILEAVKGYGLTFQGEPIQGNRRQRFANPKDVDILRQEIAKNLAKGIIEEADGHEVGEWISNVFLVPKKSKDGKGYFFLKCEQCVDFQLKYRHHFGPW